MREPRSDKHLRCEWQAHQEIISGLSSISIKQAHQRPPNAPKGYRSSAASVSRACLSLVQTGLLLVGFALIGAILAY